MQGAPWSKEWLKNLVYDSDTRVCVIVTSAEADLATQPERDTSNGIEHASIRLMWKLAQAVRLYELSSTYGVANSLHARL